MHTLAHYSFNARAKLFDIRDSAHPVDMSDPFHFDVYELYPDGDRYYDFSSDRLEITHYVVHDTSIFNLSNGSFGTIDEKLSQKYPTLPCWFPIERDIIFNTYHDLIGEKCDAIIRERDGSFEDDVSVDEMCRDIIENEDPHLHHELGLDFELFREVADHGFVDPVTYLSHDLTYMHPLFRGNNELMELHDEIEFDQYYYFTDGCRIMLIRIDRISFDPLWCGIEEVIVDCLSDCASGMCE